MHTTVLYTAELYVGHGRGDPHIWTKWSTGFLRAPLESTALYGGIAGRDWGLWRKKQKDSFFHSDVGKFSGEFKKNLKQRNNEAKYEYNKAALVA